MKRVYVFGGAGRQGYTIAERLSAWGNKVTCFDVVNQVPPGCDYQACRVEDDGLFPEIDWEKEYVDLVVNALPSSAGVTVVNAALENGVSVTDVSFVMEELDRYDFDALLANAAIIHDCGLAPGLPNLIIGCEARKAADEERSLANVAVYVGGLPQDPTLPYGYKVTWSPEDLYEEYVRTARYIKDYEIRTSHPLYTPPKSVTFDGVQYEAFMSDGLRSLLIYQGEIKDLREYTLRYPGHLEAIHKLIDLEGRDGFIDTLTRECDKGEDYVYMRVEFPHRIYTLKVLGDKYMNAMTKTTAYSVAAFSKYLLSKTDTERPLEGSYSCERLSEECPDAMPFILDTLKQLGVEFMIEDL